MRPVSIFALAATAGSFALLAACAGNSPAQSGLLPGSSAPLGTALQSSERGRPLGTCTDVRRVGARNARGRATKAARGISTPYLYVVDSCGPAIDVLRSSDYSIAGSITDGLNYPVDAFLDSHKNLFVANYGGETVTEYAPGDWSAPVFTYSANMGIPLVVTTDASGDVYEGDYNGYINEYYPGRNSPTIASCLPTAGGDNDVYGLAVDGRGDVFARIFSYKSELPEIVEYPGGLNNCASPTVLTALSPGGGGIAVDKNDNLIIGASSTVQVLDAPNYNAVSATIGSGFACATNVRLNKANDLAFVTDTCNDTVTVVNYPSGTNAAVLGTGNGISKPYAAVEAPNAVY
jgi:hypothetical protein